MPPRTHTHVHAPHAKHTLSTPNACMPPQTHTHVHAPHAKHAPSTHNACMPPQTHTRVHAPHAKHALSTHTPCSRAKRSANGRGRREMTSTCAPCHKRPSTKICLMSIWLVLLTAKVSSSSSRRETYAAASCATRPSSSRAGLVLRLIHARRLPRSDSCAARAYTWGRHKAGRGGFNPSWPT